MPFSYWAHLGGLVVLFGLLYPHQAAAQVAIHPDAVPPRTKEAFRQAASLDAPTRWLSYRKQRHYTASYADSMGRELRLRIDEEGRLITKAEWLRYNEMPDTVLAQTEAERPGWRFRKGARIYDFRTDRLLFKVLVSRGGEMHPLVFDRKDWRYIPYQQYDDVLLQEGNLEQ